MAFLLQSPPNALNQTKQWCALPAMATFSCTVRNLPLPYNINYRYWLFLLIMKCTAPSVCTKKSTIQLDLQERSCKTLILQPMPKPLVGTANGSPKLMNLGQQYNAPWKAETSHRALPHRPRGNHPAAYT